MLCCGYTLTDFPIFIRLTSLALWQSNDCPSASKATLMNMDKHFMWIHYERLHNHNKAKHNKTVCIFLGIYCMYQHVSFSCLGRAADILFSFRNFIHIFQHKMIHIAAKCDVIVNQVLFVTLKLEMTGSTVMYGMTEMPISSRTHNAIIMELRQKDVARSFWRNSDVIVGSYVPWVWTS